MLIEEEHVEASALFAEAGRSARSLFHMLQVPAGHTWEDVRDTDGNQRRVALYRELLSNPGAQPPGGA